MEITNRQTQQQTEEQRFSFFLAPATQVRPWRTMNLKQVHEYITRNADAATQTRRLRQCHDEKERRLLKKRCFAFATFSGIFDYRADSHLRQHSGLLCLDFDHVGNEFQIADLRRRLLADQQLETRLLFTSPSGDGVKWVINIDLALCDHATWFQAVKNYIQFTYRLQIDDKCSNISRSCFLPHDPTAVCIP